MLNNTLEKQKLTFACGHFEMHVKVQRDAINAGRIKSAERRICTACLAEHEARRDVMISKSVQRTEEGIARTKLTGSKKQIKWAVSIRAHWLKSAERNIPPYPLRLCFEEAQASGAAPETVQRVITNVLTARLAAIDELLAHSEASWWIDSRRLDLKIDNLTHEAIKSEFADLQQPRQAAVNNERESGHL
jgi:hypothetical protein